MCESTSLTPKDMRSKVKLLVYHGPDASFTCLGGSPMYQICLNNSQASRFPCGGWQISIVISQPNVLTTLSRMTDATHRASNPYLATTQHLELQQTTRLTLSTDVANRGSSASQSCSLRRNEKLGLIPVTRFAKTPHHLLQCIGIKTAVPSGKLSATNNAKKLNATKTRHRLQSRFR